MVVWVLVVTGFTGEKGESRMTKYAHFFCFINITWLGESVIGFNIVNSSLHDPERRLHSLHKILQRRKIDNPGGVITAPADAALDVRRRSLAPVTAGSPSSGAAAHSDGAAINPVGKGNFVGPV